MVKSMGMALRFGLMDLSMRDVGPMGLLREKGGLYQLLEIYTEVNGRETKQMDKVPISTMMG